MMTSRRLTAELTAAEDLEAKKALQAAGITADDFTDIAHNKPMRDEIVAVILKHRSFAAPEEQIERLLEINEQAWKDPAITLAAIRAIGDPPQCPRSDKGHLYCVVLLYETGDPLQTLVRNWQACEYVHQRNTITMKSVELPFTPEGIRSRADALPRSSGFRWAVAELGRQYQSCRVQDVCPILNRTRHMGMGQELPLIAALHPRWPVSMDGKNIPFAVAPDLEVLPNGQSDFNMVPSLYFSGYGGYVGIRPVPVGAKDAWCGSGSLQ